MSYRELGFSSDPFSNKALQQDDLSERLMVDRESEVSKLLRRIQESSKIPTIEGQNGVGKTSVLNIALHRAFSRSKSNKDEPLLIPCRCSFQIGKDKSAEDFLDELYLQVALTLIEQEDSLRAPPGYSKAPNEKRIKAYIDSPIIKSFTATIMGNGGGYNAAPNASKGWDKVGFRAAVEDWLRLLFPSAETGAVVCVLDNLELLHSSKSAREVIETLRDTAFSIDGLKWILCGSSGVVRGIAASPRLVGWLHKPLNIQELSDTVGGEVYDKRVKGFRIKEDAELPLTRANFITLFDMFNGNTRFALDEAGEFCTWAFDELEDAGRIASDAFERWMSEELEANHAEIFVYFEGRDEEVFEAICQVEIFTPGEHESLGVSDKREFLNILDKFVKFGLIVSSLDQDAPEDAVFEITPKALKLQYFLAQ
ncbi:hypothetical protein [Pseudophaeobacter sp. TrK17]|uniref:hypothetical protein n=1 Tax=Pseudophaeobacter sp. TrK17 TaxID=2815167 RepID=UPI0035D10653